ncbi:MAG: UDP-3-O-(3-hydroxymyristoyl)glucosamine N-acyltransferase [Planctomycetaceae bacterium]
MAVTAQELAAIIKGEVHGDAQVLIDDGRTVERAGRRHVVFAGSEAFLKKLGGCRAGAAIITRSLFKPEHLAVGIPAIIVVDDAQRAFGAALQHFRPPRARRMIGISPDAYVSPSATVGENTCIHPGAFIDDDVAIGRNCDIYPGVFIGAASRLGDDVTLYPNVVVYGNVSLGDRVTIHACAVIGADGFGYRLHGGKREKVPHFGAVRIENDVEIGACSTIDRAMIGETIIGEGTKIDNLVMVAHNCELGKHNILASLVGLAGSVSTGDNVICAGQVGVADHVHLGEGCVLGSKTGAHKDVPAGETHLGMPSQPAAEAMKVIMSQQKLPALLRTVRKLEARVEELTKKVDALSASGPSESSKTAA